MSGYGNDYSYRAYSPDANASPRRGNAPIVRPEERRGTSMPMQDHGYPPYPAGGAAPLPGQDYNHNQRLHLLDDHGDTVRVGLNGPASSTPNLVYNQAPYPQPYSTPPISASPYGTIPVPPSYGSPAPLYGSPAPSYGSNITPYGSTSPPAHHIAPSPAASYSSASAYQAPQSAQRRPVSTQYTSNDDPLAFGSSDHPSRSRSQHRTPSPTPSLSPERSPERVNRAPAGAPPSAPTLSDFIPASFTAGNAAQAASSLASFFSNAASKPASSSPAPVGATSGFNMKGVYDYLGTAASKVDTTPPTAAHPQGTMNIAGLSIDKDWIMKFIQTTNPWVLMAIVVIAFLVISQIIGMIIKFAIMGAVIYGVVLWVMKNNAEGAAGRPTVPAGRSSARIGASTGRKYR